MLNATIQIEVKPQSYETETIDPQLARGDFEVYSISKRNMHCKDRWGHKFLISELDFNHMLQNGKIAITGLIVPSLKLQPMPLFAGVS